MGHPIPDGVVSALATLSYPDAALAGVLVQCFVLFAT
jgi:hypothetical protein